MTGEKIHLLLAGGSCGNTLNLIAAHLENLLREEWSCQPKITIQNLWQHHGPPPSTDLIVQTMQVYRPDDVNCPVLSVRPLILDRNDPETIDVLRVAVSAVVLEQAQSEIAALPTAP